MRLDSIQTSALWSTVSVRVLFFFAAALLMFLPSDLTHSIDCELNGSVLNLVKTEGWYAIGLLFISLVCIEAYRCWASQRRAALPEEEKLGVIQRSDKAWKAAHKRLSAHPFMLDEAPHKSWRGIRSSHGREALGAATRAAKGVVV